MLELDARPEPKVFLLGAHAQNRGWLLSAERGANAAYIVLRRRSLLRHAYVSFFDMRHAAEHVFGVLGESAGLCFALTFAAHALAREHGQARPVTLAATGLVASGLAVAEVGRVDGNAPKMAAALA